MATVFDELRTMLDLPVDTEPFALGAACLGEIKKLRHSQKVNRAETQAWRDENRQLRNKNQELHDKTRKLLDTQESHLADIEAWRAENRKLRVSGGEDLMEATKLRAEIQELDRALNDARSATGRLYDMYRRVQTRLIDLVQLRDQNAVLSTKLDRSHTEGASLRSLASSRWFQIGQLRKQLAQQQSQFARYKNRIRHHLHAREAGIERMRKRLEQPPTSAEGAHHERELLAWLSEKDQAAERLMRIISERNQEIRDLKEAVRAGGTTMQPKRQVVQLLDWNHFLVALGSDGTVWYRDSNHPHSWVEIVPPPTA